MKTAYRIASRAKHSQPAFDISMVNYVAPTVPYSLKLKTAPGKPMVTAATAHRVAWDTDLITGLQDPGEDHIVGILIKVKSAFERLRTGEGSPMDFTRLECAFNVAYVRAEKIDPLVEQTMKAGIDALNACDRIWQMHGRFGFTGPGLTAMQDAVELYEGILRQSAPVLMEQAAIEAARRMLAQAQGVAA